MDGDVAPIDKTIAFVNYCLEPLTAQISIESIGKPKMVCTRLQKKILKYV